MESPVLHALSCIVADAPWYAVACVPFWQTKRIKTGTLIHVLLELLVLRAAGAYLVAAYARNWALWETCFTIGFYLVMLTGYITLSGARPATVVYIFLVLFNLACFSNLLAGIMVMPLLPQGRSPHDTLWYIAALAVLRALLLPLVYKMFRVLMRRAFSQLPGRSILMLCFTPSVFFLLTPLIGLSATAGTTTLVMAVLSLLGFAACYFNVYIMLDTAKNFQNESVLLLEKRLAQEGYARVDAHLREVAGLKHDMRRHLAAIHAYLEYGRVEEAREYLARYADQSASVTEIAYSGHFLLDAVIGNLYQRADTQGVRVEVNLRATPARIADPDLYSLLFNLVDNALEACAAVPEGRDRFICLTVARRDPYLNIRCRNSKAGDIIQADGKIQTAKSEGGHGYGLSTIGRVVDAYDGMMNVEHDENTFTVMLARREGGIHGR